MFLGELGRIASEIAAAYKATRTEMRDVQRAHDRATVTGTARVVVDHKAYTVSRDSAGRSMEPVKKNQVAG